MARQVSRSKFAIDIMYRLWDSANSCWVIAQGRSIWASKGAPGKARERLITEGRNPDTLVVERVFVSISENRQ